MVLRNFLFKLLKNRPGDGYQVGIFIDGIKTSDERDAIAARLVEMRCLEKGWSGVGRTGIHGQFNYDVIEKLIKNGVIR